MCGIVGFSIDNYSQTKNILQQMLSVISYRGPDHQGTYNCEKLAIGSCRLSIIDLEKANQPISSEDNLIWTVFNGEIYNFQTLRRQLIEKGHIFKTASDTELLVHLWQEYKENMLSFLDGMFSFAILDLTENRLFLARDPLGKKPLFYFYNGENIVFASEIKALFKNPLVTKKINLESIEKYFLHGFIPQPDTAFKDIQSLKAGHYLSFKNKQIEIKPYFNFLLSQTPETNTKSLTIKTEQLLIEAIEKRLISDVPLGIFLSSGIDSSLIAAILAKKLNKKIESFSIGFKEASHDESHMANAISKYLGIKNYTKIFSAKDLLGLIEKIPFITENPFCDYSILSTYLLSGFAKEKIKVALSGDGGDEIFGGYKKYSALLYSLFIKKLNMPKLNLRRKGITRIARNFLEGLNYPYYQRGIFWDSPFKPYELPMLLKHCANISYAQDLDNLLTSKDKLNNFIFWDINYRLQNSFLLKIDRTSMLNSLEVRCPYLDKKLISFCLNIDSRHKASFFKGKILLRNIISKYLPKKLINPKKIGFGIPLKIWLRTDLRKFTIELLKQSKLAQADILNQKAIDFYLNSHINNKEDLHNRIWALITLESWFRQWF